MEQNSRIQSLISLGNFLSDPDDPSIAKAIQDARARNGWFTEESIRSSIEGVVELLDPQNISQWLSSVPSISREPKKIGVVMAGNIPMVGFHDLLCILIAGDHALMKLSSEDSILIPFVCNALVSINPEMVGQVSFVDKLQDMDAVIATGSDNSARYFEYYFSKYPHIIRKNRTSVGILDGKETEKDFDQLGQDILQYFGLGCRNISKLYVPKDYDFTLFYEAIEHRKEISYVSKYVNNYDYNKSIYLVNREDFKDNGFLLLKKDVAFVSPISVVFYETYQSIEEVGRHLNDNNEKIQVITSRDGHWPGSIPFGTAQKPKPWDYADNVDTIEFLSKLR